MNSIRKKYFFLIQVSQSPLNTCTMLRSSLKKYSIGNKDLFYTRFRLSK